MMAGMVKPHIVVNSVCREYDNAARDDCEAVYFYGVWLLTDLLYDFLNICSNHFCICYVIN